MQTAIAGCSKQREREMAGGNGIVRGVIMDEAVVLQQNQECLQPGAESLLRKLRYSGIRTGISYGPGLSSRKVSLLKRMANLHSVDCFMLDASSTYAAIHEVMLSWHDIGGSILYLVSNEKKDISLELSNCNWLITVLNTEGGSSCESSSIIQINRLDELPLTICHFNRKETGKNVTTVGYVMKPSRQEDFAKRGAFPMYPTKNGLMFLPLTFELPLSPQLQEVDIVLHKATDEILSIELSGSSGHPNKITYTRGMQELKCYMDHHVDFCVIDPLDNIYPVLDRHKIQQILLGLEDVNTSGVKIRGPHFLKVDDFNEPDFLQRLSKAKLSLPSIVKPQVACGVPDAHSMAIVFKVEDFKDLSVPLPAVIQEYVNHSSILYKFYVLGEKVFYAVKNSTPNTDTLMKLCGSNELRPLVFDSLKSLPTANEKEHRVNERIDHDRVRDAAEWLMRNLGLTIFGFDVVIEERSGEHVIVDVNYLPSFKEVPDDVAIPALWDAIKRKSESRRTQREENKC
ncbi:inositol 1,3,4-trisphosphate 5/6-kinase 4 isoform X2 [Ziziphus jujuba]|uniref:inositol-1,3,4-trisphosphate 5/6-kinase n=1 Tax=Ziziphus jujuba TaxID=326968 RepID=A0A6P3ZII7_ZIZJJ|nr:inositol 1,3,4-trisphosphate 5/6-kinase 4 isoform X2 [Ziziphus jujuba]